MTGTIDAEALAIAIGEARCREFGVRQIRTFADTDDGIPGTVIAVSVSQEDPPFWDLVARAPRLCYPLRLVAFFTEILDAMAMLEIDVPASLGEALALAYSTSHHRPPGEDLLEAVAERAAAGEAYGETPMFPAGALETIVAGGQLPPDLAKQPGGEWLIHCLSHYPLFNPQKDGHWFDILVVPELAMGETLTPDQLRATAIMMYGWNMGLAHLDEIVPDLARILAQVPESSAVIEAA